VEKLEERERELGITPDPALAAYIAALQKAGRQNMITDLMLKTLGLDICAETLVVSPAGLACKKFGVLLLASMMLWRQLQQACKSLQQLRQWLPHGDDGWDWVPG
jgi:hypothetical protein